MRKILTLGFLPREWRPLTLAVALGFAAGPVVEATVIEGFTPSGQFVTVGVSETGRLLIDISSIGVAAAVVFPSSQPVTAFQGSTPWVVTSTGIPVTMSGSLVVSPTTSTINATTQVSVTSAGQTLCSASATRLGCMFCNQSPSINVYWGTTGVTTGSGLLLEPGSCASPDTPTITKSAVVAITTTTAVAPVGVLTLGP